jgi:hypothetical protein
MAIAEAAIKAKALREDPAAEAIRFSFQVVMIRLPPSGYSTMKP